jgi:uncharacterized DUF497 family protein
MLAQFRFDWDDSNVGHLRRHKVTPIEFEEVLLNEPLDLEYETETGEERYKSLGATRLGRILIAVWMVRDGSIRAITAYPASAQYRKTYLRYRGAS